MNLEHPVGPQSKEVIKKKWVYVKATQEPNERVPNAQSRNNVSNKINKTVLDYNPNHKNKTMSLYWHFNQYVLTLKSL